MEWPKTQETTQAVLPLSGRVEPGSRVFVQGEPVTVVSVIAAYPIGHRRMVAPNVGIALGAAINFVASVGAI